MNAVGLRFQAQAFHAREGSSSSCNLGDANFRVEAATRGEEGKEKKSCTIGCRLLVLVGGRS